MLQGLNNGDCRIFTLYASVSDGDDSETRLAIDDNIGCKSIDAYLTFWQAMRITKTRSRS